MSTWQTLESARDQWADAPLDDDDLSELLEVAKVAVLAFAPVVDTETPAEYTATSAEPEVATLTLAPVSGFVSATFDVRDAGAWVGEGVFAVPAAYLPSTVLQFATTDGALLMYNLVGNLGILRLVVGEGVRSITGTWAPATPFGDVPASYRRAQLMHARNVWNSSQASPSGDFDGGGYGLTTFPLDWQVKQLLRPRSVFGGPVG